MRAVYPTFWTIVVCDSVNDEGYDDDFIDWALDENNKHAGSIDDAKVQPAYNICFLFIPPADTNYWPVALMNVRAGPNI